MLIYIKKCTVSRVLHPKKIILDYPTKSAANVLGYISEVDQRITKNDDYEQGDLIGKAGIEQQYEGTSG